MITLLKIRNSYANPLHKEYLIDSENDVADLPDSVLEENEDNVCAVGSMAYTADLSLMYMLDNHNVWTEIKGEKL